jgi:hypothetical protein
MTESDWKQHLASLNEDSQKFIFEQFSFALKRGAEIASLKRKAPDLSDRVEELEQKNALLSEQLRERETYVAASSAKQKEVFDIKVREEVDKRLAEYFDTFTKLNNDRNALYAELANKNIELMKLRINYAMEIEKRDATIEIQKTKLASIETPLTHVLVVLANDTLETARDKYRVVRVCKNDVASGLSRAYKDNYNREIVRLSVCRDDNWGLIKNSWDGASFNHNYATLMPGVSEDMFVAMIRNYEGACVKV